MSVMKTPCQGCGRHVAGRTQTQRRQGRGGKHRMPHKCPHGEHCVAGHPLANQGWNWPDCPKCFIDRSRERSKAGTSEPTRSYRTFGNYGLTGKAR